MLNMKKNVKVREILGRECNIEDAILLREIIKNNFFKNNVYMKINKVNTNIKMCLHHALCF